MAELFIDIPFLNPVRFAELEVPVFKDMDNTLFYNLIRNYEQKVQYLQKWLDGDIISFQFACNYSPVQLDLYDCKARFVTSYVANIVDTDLINPGFYTYEVQVPITALSTKLSYYFIISAGTAGDDTLLQRRSEPFQVLMSAGNTVLFNYWNSFNKGDVVFDTGIKFTFRCEATIGRLQPKTKRTLWEDQPLNLRTINAIPYRQRRLTIGDGKGVPEWVADLVNDIMACDTSILNGKQYTAVDGAELEANEEDDYPMCGWSMDIQETKNRSSVRSTTNNSPADNFFVVRNIDTKAFGTFNGNASSNIIQVTEVE